MRKLITLIILWVGVAIGANATILFPFFVDIAPDYEYGLTAELQAAGVTSAMYHSTKPGFICSTFREAENFLKDVLPDDVERTVTDKDGISLVVYRSVQTNEVEKIFSTIYLLPRKDGSFVAAFDEYKEDLDHK